MSNLQKFPVATGGHYDGGSEPPLMSGEQESGGFSVAQVVAILWAHRKQSLIIFVSLAVLLTVAIKLLPKTFVATATIVVNYEVNDPLGGQEFPVMLMDNYITTQIQLMQSSEVLLPVVDKLDLTKHKDFAAGYKGDGSLRDWAKAQLIKRLAITHNGGTQLIYVTADAKTALEAALIANTVADVYIGQQTQRLNKPAALRAGRYAEQLDELKEKVNAAQEKVTEFRQRTGLTDVMASNNDADVTALNLLESQYQGALNSLRAAEVNQSTEQDVTRAASTSQLVQNLKGQLATLQSQLAESTTTYGPKHPKVVELQSQIDSVKIALANEMKTISTGSNVELSATRSLVARLQPALEAQRKKVMATRQLQDEGAKLLLELDSARAVYKQALDGYDKITAAAEGQYTNVSVMNRAEAPLKSTKPNKAKLLVLALGFSGGTGVVIPFLMDVLLRRRIRCKDDVERDLAVPVLAEFEPIAPVSEAA